MAENVALSSEPVGRRSRPRRRSSLRRALRTVSRAALLLAALPLVLLPLYAVADPPVSTVMLWKSLGGAAIGKQWTDLDEISPNLVRAVLASEDARFCEHNGIDWVEMEKAMGDEDGRPRGASTVTMQTVKNLFLWTQRSWIRKGLEFPLALYAELVLSKKRILEIYLNIAELGDGIYGAAAASEHYFGVGPAELSKAQAAQLAAILPAPLARNAAKPSRQTRAAARRIAGRAAASGGYFGCVLD